MSVSPRALIVLAVALLALLTTCSGPRLWQAAAPDSSVRPLAALDIAPPRVITRPPTGAGQPIALAGEPTPALVLGGVAAPLAGVSVVDKSPTGAALDSYLSDLSQGGLFQGAVLVAHNGQVLLRKGYGPADSAGTPVTPQTRFRLASLTKQFTAAAIMILEARGALKLDDSVCAYIDGCPAAWQPITIRHLLTHTSGLPNYTDFADFDARQAAPTTPAELLARIRDLPLGFTPGTLYSYNNSGYMLLGLVVERVSGQPYEEFVRQAIFTPLAMRDSGVDHNAGTFSAGAVGFSAVGQPASFLDTSTLFACGSLYSTVEDLYRWDQALYGNLPLPQAQRDGIFTPGLGSYGFGWWITSPNGRRLISHQGNISGFSNFIARYPDEHLTIIVLSNLETADAPGMAAYMANIVLAN